MVRSLPSPNAPWLVFGMLSLCGFYFIVLQMALSHAPDRFLEVHKASYVPLSVSHNTLPLVDKVLTPLISFFVAAFSNASSPAYPTVVHFVWSFGCAIQVPLLESKRVGMNGKSHIIKLLSHPMIWGILYQRLSGGWIIPLWLALFMQSTVRADGTDIEQYKAESVLAGWWIGHTLPALVMLVPAQPAFRKTPIWVAFPILMSLAQHAYLFLRRRMTSNDGKTGMQSGYLMTQLLYLSGCIGAFLAHVHLVLIPGLSTASWSTPTHVVSLNKFVGLGKFLYAFFVPATGLRIPCPAETTAESGVVHFVQFDVIVVFSAIWTALVWDLAMRRDPPHKLDTFKWVTKVGLALFVGSLIVSPGAATSLLLLYRESVLRSARRLAKHRSTPPFDQKPHIATLSVAGKYSVKAKLPTAQEQASNFLDCKNLPATI